MRLGLRVTQATRATPEPKAMTATMVMQVLEVLLEQAGLLAMTETPETPATTVQRALEEQRATTVTQAILVIPETTALAVTAVHEATQGIAVEQAAPGTQATAAVVVAVVLVGRLRLTLAPPVTLETAPRDPVALVGPVARHPQTLR